LGYCVYTNYSINIQIWILAISCCEAILKFIACRRLPSMTGGLIAVVVIVVVIIIIKSSCVFPGFSQLECLVSSSPRGA